MGLDAIAYGPDEVCLLTVDGPVLLAYDAESEAPRWQLALERTLVGVLFANPQVLPVSGANPWRAQSLARAAVAIDAEGHLHLVDTTLGQSVGEIGPFGRPLAVASSLPGAALALAVEGQVLVWRNGEQQQVPLARARALAFSVDGDTLAVGNEKGELRMFHLGGSKGPAQTFQVDLRGAISALAQHPDGSWVVVTAQGVHLVTASSTTRLDKLSAATRRLCFDGIGGRLAMQTSERGIVVYEWPRLAVLLRVEYTDRPVRGLAFGPDDWLGVALDHGDGNKIDVVTSDVNRTDTHPGRQHRSWTLLVEGKKERLSAKEAEDVRRMKDPFHTPAPASTGFGRSALGGRIGIGAMISIALISLRVCVVMSRPSSSSWNSYSPSQYSPSLTGPRCDRACAAARLRTLQATCEAPATGCAADANAALRALEDGKCAEAKAALTRIRAASGAQPGGSSLSVDLLLADLGLGEACASGTIRPRISKRAELVRLKGPGLVPSYEEIPPASPTTDEIPSSIWAAPDGTIFVATRPPLDARDGAVVVYRSTKPGSWSIAVYEKQGSTRAQLFGRTSSDLYVMTDNVLSHFDGNAWNAVPVPPSVDLFTASGSSGADLYLAATDDSGTQVHRRRGGTWAREQTPADVSITKLFGGAGSTLWALADDSQDGQVLLLRSVGGTWTKKSPASDTGSRRMSDVWVSPTGETFVATRDGVFRSRNGGATWISDEPPLPVDELWGRSSSDVYGRTTFGLVHFDGKEWSSTPYEDDIASFTGTPTEVLVVRIAQDPAADR